MKFKVSLFLICAIALASCVDIPDFDDTPKIFYNGVDHYPDIDTLDNEIERIIISIDFEDGDGDLGVPDEDLGDTIKYPEGNYELITSTLENNKWVDRIPEVTDRNFFPVLKTDGKPGPIKGTLDLNTFAMKSNSAKLVWHKWKIRIRDRAGRISNQVVTDSIQIPRT